MMNLTSINTRPRGAVLLMVVFTLLALGAVTATMSGFISTTHVEQAHSATARQAFYAAEAGIRIVAAEYNKSAVTDDKSDMLEDVSGKTFNLTGDGSQQFDLNVFSYGFQVASHDASTNTIVAKAIGNIPLQDMEDLSSSTIDFPAGSMISVQDEVGNDIPVTLASAGSISTGAGGTQYVTFTYTPPTGTIPIDASADLDFVGIANQTSNGVSGNADAVSGLPSSMDNFPAHNGRIAIYGEDKTYTYRTLTVEANGSVTLSGLEPESGTFSLADFQSETLILRKTYGFQSIGRVTTGGTTATKVLAYYDSPVENAAELDPDADAAGPTILMYDVSDFNANDLTDSDGDNVVAIKAYTASQGNHTYYAAIHSLCENPWVNTPCEHTLRLGRETDFSDRWKVDTRLSYDVQVKLSTAWKLPFGMNGVLVRYHRSGSNTNFYGFSFMKYIDPTETTLPSGVVGDHIPNELKPPGQGSTISRWQQAPEYEGGSRPLNITENDNILLVFWRQAGSRREWLAYKEVTDDLAAYPKQWSGDGRIISDNTTLLVRVEEQFVQGKKVNRIKVFYGDASYQIPSIVARTPDTLPYDIIAGNGERGRSRYQTEWDSSRTHAFPSWPPYTIGDWAITDDFFTHIQSAPTYRVDGTLRPCTWDAVNSTAINSTALAAADIRILSDGATIRTQEFLTPNSASWPASITNWPGNRPEIAFHAAGRMITYSYERRGWRWRAYSDPYNYGATLDDLTYRFLFYN
ncbi:hypothetical protein [Desulfovibrio ferrophilus]|uniref:Uncharacterized protein n=1 Tax=Desulfovibrio ferrophilus TaxID=241368 RepID=A0A2Z6AZ85_9BACT|nr:hypothetical protein [Desulfovibrio ferrophilus]BBD08528.1 uncharacterized protein DFE_1802 [Desulfovibrio ferrophilus]